LGGWAETGRCGGRPQTDPLPFNLLWKRFFDDGTGSIDTPLWNFHDDSDQAVSVFVIA
jgi:hypothetical protein